MAGLAPCVLSIRQTMKNGACSLLHLVRHSTTLYYRLNRIIDFYEIEPNKHPEKPSLRIQYWREFCFTSMGTNSIAFSITSYSFRCRRRCADLSLPGVAFVDVAVALISTEDAILLLFTQLFRISYILQRQQQKRTVVG